MKHLLGGMPKSREENMKRKGLDMDKRYRFRRTVFISALSSRASSLSSASLYCAPPPAANVLWHIRRAMR